MPHKEVVMRGEKAEPTIDNVERSTHFCDKSPVISMDHGR
jgi:hypothetical protein